MSADVRDLVLPDGGNLQYFLDEDADPQAALLIYHHGTPAAGPLDPVVTAAARANGLRMVELVRPGYGASTRQVGRTVADVAPLAAALADHFGADRFVTLGWSGGGPHAIATAALLPDRCAGALSLAGVGAFGEPDLDFLAGMGQDNIDEFGAALAGAVGLEAYLSAASEGLRVVTADDVIAEIASLLPPVDREVLTGATAEQFARVFRWAVATGIWGWFDDDIAFTRPWGFELAEITRPIAVWQGTEDLMVPAAHGPWLVAHLPTAVPHLVDGEGHLSLFGSIGEGLAELRSWLYR